MISLNKLFFGIPKTGTRKTIIKYLEGKTFESYHNPSAGRFAGAEILANIRIPSKEIYCSDISLFSSILGYYLSNKEIKQLQISINDENVFEADMETNTTENIARLLLSLKYFTMKETNNYISSYKRSLIENKEFHIQNLSESLKSLYDKLNGIHYDILDLLKIEDELQDKEKFYFIDPPIYSSDDYIKMFDTNGKITWAQPEISYFDPKVQINPLLKKYLNAKATIILYISVNKEKKLDDFNLQGWTKIYLKKEPTGRRDYLLVNKESNIRIVERPTDTITSINCPIYSLEDFKNTSI